jgi:L-threonate 2-dehydrogenase
VPPHAPRRTIGVVGNMGLGMALRLRERGYPVRAHDLDAAREAVDLSQGATVHADAMSVARGSAALIVAVVDAGLTRDVLFGARGAAHGLELGAAVLPCPTIALRNWRRTTWTALTRRCPVAPHA